MKTISLHVEAVSRNNGRSIVQLAAYCSRSKLHDDRANKTYNYARRRKELVFHKVLLPNNAPRGYSNSEVLWNAVEQIENRKNSRLARHIIAALPKELDRDSQIRMALEYCQSFFVQQGMCADVSIHDKGDGNPHTHILLTTRSMDEEGRWMYKQKLNYVRDEHGHKVVNPKTGKYKIGKSIKANNWDDRTHIEEWRKGWADACNEKYFELYLREKESGKWSRPQRVTHMSYERQGIDQVPMIHLGAKASRLEGRGIATERGDYNRRAIEQNKSKGRERLRNKSKERSRAYRGKERERSAENERER